jgi:hypothetical protein
MKILKVLMYLIIALIVAFYLWNPKFDNVHKYLPEDIPKHLVPNQLDAIDLSFGVCVYIIYEIGAFFGLSYNAANIWIFVVIMPSVIIILILYCISLRKKIKFLIK